MASQIDNNKPKIVINEEKKKYLAPSWINVCMGPQGFLCTNSSCFIYWPWIGFRGETSHPMFAKDASFT